MEPISLSIQALTALIAGVNSLRQSLEIRRQNREMTPEEEAAFDAAVAGEMSQPWWKKSTDTPPAGPPV